MSQIEDLQAIDDFFDIKVDDSPAVSSLKLDWLRWYTGLSYYGMYFDSSVLAEAKRRRNQLHAALSAPAPKQAPAVAIAVPKVEPITAKIRQTKPVNTPIPKGYRILQNWELKGSVLNFARQALANAVPIGKRQATIINGKHYEALTEWKYDNSVPNTAEPGKPVWYPGVTLITIA